MKKIKNGPDAATGKTTAQEKYEKKMAKYLANKARKEQMAKTSSSQTTAKLIDQTIEISDLKEAASILRKFAKKHYEERKTFTFIPIKYKGVCNLVMAINFGTSQSDLTTQTITIDGTNERNELDVLWDKIIDSELDNYCINLCMRGKSLPKQKYIKANTFDEAFAIAIEENKIHFANKEEYKEIEGGFYKIA